MLSFLEGRVCSNSPLLVLDCSGLGFEVNMPSKDLSDFKEGERRKVEVFLILSQEGPKIYGFLEHEEKRTFSLLLKVPGIGPKAALSILSGVEIPKLARCVRNGDSTPLLKVPGIGPKAASRIVSSLQDSDWGFAAAGLAGDGVVEALESLGWKGAPALDAYKIAKRSFPHSDSSSLLKACLQILDKHA